MRKLLLLSLALFSLAASAQTPSTSNSTVQLSANSGTIPVRVNCDKGESLNRALSRLNKDVPATVSVKGTCTEYVQVNGFENLTLQGLPGAEIVEPSAGAAGAKGLLEIEASRSIVVERFTVDALTTGPAAVAVGHGSTDVLLRNLTVVGGSSGIAVYERSQVGITQVTARNPGYTPLGIYDVSDVHVESGCLFEDTTGTQWHPGIDVASGHLTIRGVTIRNMQVGIWVRSGGNVNVQNTTNYAPAGGSTEVLIESPSAVNYNGVQVEENSTLSVSDAVLRITNVGRSYGGWSGGILVQNDSSLNASQNLIISGSQGQGIVVTDASHAVLNGSSITGSLHGGLVVGNLSTVTGLSYPKLPTTVSGNGVDLFCDSRSLIAGAGNIVGATAVKCANLVSGTNESLP